MTRAQKEFKGTQSALDRVDLVTTVVFSIWKEFNPTWNQSHLEIRLYLRSVLLDFQSFPKKIVFECAFARPIMLFLSYLVNNGMDRVSVICKLAMKRYLIRKCASWLCPFKRINEQGILSWNINYALLWLPKHFYVELFPSDCRR